MNWVDPKLVTNANGYVLVQAPFSCDIPEGHTVMVSVRAIDNGNTIFPDGGFTDMSEFINEFPTYFDVKVLHNAKYIDKYQGVDNAGMFLGIDDAGNVMPTSPYQKTTTEHLDFTYTTSYPSLDAFEYTEGGADYWLYKQSETQGGVLSVQWDETQLSQIDIVIYLFDADGKPYKLISNGGGVAGYVIQPPFKGENVELLWSPVGAMGYCKAQGSFTTKIPDGCTCMISMRAINAVLPEGSIYSTTWSDSNYLGKYAKSVFDVKLTKTTNYDPEKLLSINQGEENANRILTTDKNGNVTPGKINPQSTGLRPGWETVIHRGWIAEVPENTLPAYWLTKEHGYSWGECDVRISSDGIPVLAHDATLTGTNAEGETVTLTVAESTVSELKALTLATDTRFGNIVMPTLAELLDMARVIGLNVFLDIKIGGETEMASIAKTVLRYNMSDRVVYATFSTVYAGQICAVDRNASFAITSYDTEPNAETDLRPWQPFLTGANHVDYFVQANTWEFDEAVIDAVNTAGFGLMFWNVLKENLDNCINAGARMLIKHNNEDTVDLDAIYLANRTYW